MSSWNFMFTWGFMRQSPYKSSYLSVGSALRAAWNDAMATVGSSCFTWYRPSLNHAHFALEIVVKYIVHHKRNIIWDKTSLNHIWAITMTNKNNKMSVQSEDSDQPGHLPRLIIVFDVPSLGNLGLKLFSCGQWRFWCFGWSRSSCDVQQQCCFSDAVAHLVCNRNKKSIYFVLLKKNWRWQKK